jgi:hypothetical protein
MNHPRMQWTKQIVVASTAGLVWASLSLTSCSANSARNTEAVGQSQSALCSGQGTLAASPPGSTQVGTPVVFTLTPSCDTGDTPEWQLYMLPGGSSSWTRLSDWSTTLTFTWDTSAIATGSYFFEALVKSTASTATYDSYADLSWYSVDPPGSCTGVVGSIAPSGAAAGTAITVSASATCPSSGSTCGEGSVTGCPQYRFWVKPNMGQWEILQDWSDSAAANFVGNDSTVYSDGHPDYRFEVDVRATGNGNSSYDAWTEVDYNYASPGSCPSGDTICNKTECIDTSTDPENCGGCAQDSGATGQVCSSSQTCNGGTCGTQGTCSSTTGTGSPNPAQAGTPVTLTGNATCSSGTAEYEFWILPPGGAWTNYQTYSASNTYTWNTTGLSPGSYQIEIDAKESGASGGYQSYVIFTEVIQASTNCSSVTASAGPPSEAAGNPVTISAMATCSAGATALYRFWVQPPGGAWQVFQDWSTSATADFIGSDSSGGYRVEVDTVAQGNGNTGYDSWTEVDYAYAAAGSCPMGYTTCDVSVCACGACGSVCPTGQTCTSGSCM